MSAEELATLMELCRKPGDRDDDIAALGRALEIVTERLRGKDDTKPDETKGDTP